MFRVYEENEDCTGQEDGNLGRGFTVPGGWFSEKEHIWGVTFETRRILTRDCFPS